MAPEGRDERRPSGGGSPNDRPTRVLIVDDHQSFSEALGLAIGLQSDLECVGTAATLGEATALVPGRCPDVVLMDVRLPDGDGIDGTARVKALCPETRVVILTAHADLEIVARAAAAGAAGFLPKSSSVVQVLDAIRTAGSGGMLVEHSTLMQVVSRIRDGEGPAPQREASPSLTHREHEVLLLLGEGLDPSSIARRLGVSLHTTRGHVQNVLGKLGAHSQLEAVVAAVRRGLIPGPQA